MTQRLTITDKDVDDAFADLVTRGLAELEEVVDDEHTPAPVGPGERSETEPAESAPARIEIPEQRPETDVARPLAQGDLLLIPGELLEGLRGQGIPPTSKAIDAGAQGVAILGGGRSGNVHSVHGEGVLWARSTGSRACQIGVITVADGSVGEVRHTAEHTPLLLQPGVWVVHRQRSLD